MFRPAALLLCLANVAVPQGAGGLLQRVPDEGSPRTHGTLEEPTLHHGIRAADIAGGGLVPGVRRDGAPALSGTARAHTGVYQGGDCPCGDGIPEGEPDCGLDGGGNAADTTNGGCNFTPRRFTPLALGETVCGTSGSSTTARDTDWYELVLTATTLVEWRVEAEFPVEAAVINNGGNPAACTTAFLFTDTAAGCGEVARVTATLPAGTWWFWVGTTAASVPCGSQYRATLEEPCTFYTDEAAFDAAYPALQLEDFEDTTIAPAGVCVDVTPWEAVTANACIAPGEVEYGLSIENPQGGNVLLLGLGYVGGGNPADSICVVSQNLTTDLRFTPAVTRVGFTLEDYSPGPQTALIQAFGIGGDLLASVAAPIGDSVQTFWGMACTTPIALVRIIPGSGLVDYVDNIRYGSDLTACTTYADSAVFDALFPGLALEDFEDGSAPSGTFCAAPGPWDDTTVNACLDAGDIEPGLSIDDALEGNAVALGALGYTCTFPLGSQAVVGAATLATDLAFSPPVTAVGFGLESWCLSSVVVGIDVIGLGGDAITADLVTVGDTPGFWGIECDEAIALIRVTPLAGGADLVWIDDVRFGDTTNFVRFCTGESVASPNTGLATRMVLESQDADGDLLGFLPSIGQNAAPNRLMMIAAGAPGPGNGGVTNIGYFIMGTGANTFVPPGSAGPICVAPGIRRYLPPVNMTDETIVLHDPQSGAPTTLVGQGFARPALGAGAHPVGPANIGGAAGFHWSFQAWHRDSPAPSNLSDAIAVDFVP